MDAPPIRYTRTSDGVNIAYWTLGEGPPLLWLPTQQAVPWVVFQDQPETQAWFERIAQRWQIVRYDQRGVGLSRAPDVDRALDACIHDIDAVLDATGHTQISLWAGMLAGPLAIAYAARNPDRVAQLILWCSFAATDDMRDAPSVIAPRAIASGSDRKSLVRAITTPATGWSHPEYARNFVASWLAHSTQDEYETANRILRGDDVTELLPSVACPSLVMYPDDSIVPLDLGRKLAADIPGAQLRVFAGDSQLPELGAADEIFDAIVEFLPADSGSAAADARPSGFRTILFTDLESSTALTQRLGDEKAQEIVRGHNTTVRQALNDHGGDEVKHTGDGIMASFPSAVSAVQAALAMQRDLAGAEVRVRIGLNAGEPIAEDDDLFGTAVQLAARITDRAEPGQVLVSRVVADLCAGKTFVFTSVGEATLKGFDETVALYEVTPQSST